MKRFFFCLTLTLIAFAINADYYDPNSTFDYDQQTVGLHYASAFASEYYYESADTYWYIADASASFSADPDAGGPAAWSLTVEATPMDSDSDSGLTWPGSSKYMSASAGQMYNPSDAWGNGSMGAACAYAGI